MIICDPHSLGLDTTYPSHLMKYDELTGVLTEIQVSENLNKVGPVAIVNDSTFYVADFNNESGNTPDRMMKSTNGGLSWNDLSLNTVYHKPGGNWVPYNNLGHTIDYKSISGIVTNPISPDNIWVGITGVWTDNNGEPDPGKFRVLHSTNGGSTWYDYSEGLPAFPIEALEYQPGSNDRIFAGTDVGVFYRDAGMSQWECFSNQLPVCIITDLDYESCSRTLYASTYGRAIFKTYIPFDVEVSTDTLTSQANIHWNQPRQIHNNIFIPAGTTLTITGNLYMDMGTSIIVDRSANLIVENCTITNACNELWNGIEVWGYADTSQYYSGVQGRIDLENAEISNMQTGIIAAKTKQGGYDRGFEGGIIRAKDCSFINNNRSIALGPYQNFHPVSGNEMDNFSRFERCTFKVTSANSEHVNLEHHAYLASVKGIRFKGCHFSDESALSMPSSGTVGIYSIGSSFVVTESCLDPTISPCQQFQTGSFLRLNYGVKAYGLRKGNSCIIEKATFNGNYTGIYLSAMDESAINLNSFSMNNPYDSTHTNPLLCGLYLDHCTGYQVEENSFSSTYSVSNLKHTIGITINNSGEENNDIYNNTCSHLFAGILAQNVNRSETGQFGLEIKCNDFSICEYDIAVTADTAYSHVGIKASQGAPDDDPEAPANNIFSYTHNNPVSDYYNEGGDITYYYAYYDGGFNLEPEYYSTPEVNPQSDPGQTFTFSISSGCKSSFTSSGGGGVEENRSKMANAETKIDSTKNLLTLLVDGGDTEALSTEVETSFPDEAIELRNELIATSPYLSDSVMVNTVEQENVLTEAMVTEILMANPQSAKSDTVQQALDNRFDQLTEDQRTDIDQGWFVTGAKESLESNLGRYQAQRQQALNNIIRIFRNDSLCEASNDSVIAQLGNENSLSSRYTMAFEYFAKADYIAASATLTDIPASFTLRTAQIHQHQQYVDYLNLLIQLSNQNRSILDCDSSQQAILFNVLNNADGDLQMLARNALVNLDAINYTEPYILPGEGLKEEKIRRIPVRKYYTVDKFKLYPNPAGSYIIIEYTLQGEMPQGMVNIIDNKGMIIRTIPLTKSHDYMVIEINDLPSGIYYCNFEVNAVSVQTEKLIISH